MGEGGFGEDEPEAVVAEGGGGVVAEHEDEQVAGVDGEAGEHAADLGREGGDGVEDEGVGRPFGGGHGGQGSRCGESCNWFTLNDLAIQGRLWKQCWP